MFSQILQKVARVNSLASHYIEYSASFLLRASAVRVSSITRLLVFTRDKLPALQFRLPVCCNSLQSVRLRTYGKWMSQGITEC